MGGHRGLVVTATLQAWTGHAEQGQASRQVDELVGFVWKIICFDGFLGESLSQLA